MSAGATRPRRSNGSSASSNAGSWLGNAARCRVAVASIIVAAWRGSAPRSRRFRGRNAKPSGWRLSGHTSAGRQSAAPRKRAAGPRPCTHEPAPYSPRRFLIRHPEVRADGSGLRPARRQAPQASKGRRQPYSSRLGAARPASGRRSTRVSNDPARREEGGARLFGRARHLHHPEMAADDLRLRGRHLHGRSRPGRGARAGARQGGPARHQAGEHLHRGPARGIRARLRVPDVPRQRGV